MTSLETSTICAVSMGQRKGFLKRELCRLSSNKVVNSCFDKEFVSAGDRFILRMLPRPMRQCYFGSSMNTPSRVPSPAGTPVPAGLRVNKALIEPVLAHPNRIRNVCILAHVDHGKTTLTDSLLASNGIISFKQAGKLRYMDSREDEQERGITMQASAITLLYDAPITPDAVQRHAINLIDSPGHVDFSRQVVTAARLVDGCLVLIDAVEGVCTQTMAVLRQARRERLVPCLVINKIDRLITELNLSSTDAAEWLFKLVEQVNAVQATIKLDLDHDLSLPGDPLDSTDLDNEPLEHVIFDPLKGNVVFASSTDGWAFSVEKFVQIYSTKLEMKASALRQTLWGHFYYQASTRKILPQGPDHIPGSSKPMFAQFILDPIWAVYQASIGTWNEEKLEKIILQTKSHVSSRDIKAKDGRVILRTILGQWLPLAETVFNLIISHIPSPLESNRIRLDSLVKINSQLPSESRDIVEKLASPGNPDSEPTVAFVSKFFSVNWGKTVRSSLPSRNPSHEDLSFTFNELHIEPDGETMTEKLIGMARIFHGTINRGQKLYILGPKHSPNIPDFMQIEINELYLLMGRDIEPVEKVHAGCIFGIGGIAAFTKKFATLSSSLFCPLLEETKGEVVPIVQVALRPAQLEYLPDLVHGLELLCQADPCAEYHLQEENGELILATAGELHLEQCLKDLRERYTKNETNIIVSSPIIPFRETISDEKNRNEEAWKVHLGPDDTVCPENGLITLTTMDGRCRIGARAVPLPSDIGKFILGNRKSMMNAFAKQDEPESRAICSQLNQLLRETPIRDLDGKESTIVIVF